MRSFPLLKSEYIFNVSRVRSVQECNKVFLLPFEGSNIRSNFLMDSVYQF